MLSAGASQLLALDWGTSSLRVMLMRAGEVVESRRSDAGVQQLRSGPAGFEQALAALAGDWLGRWPGLPALACGTIGSAQGWREAPYQACPADPRTLAGGCVNVPNGLGIELRIVPGLRCDAAGRLPDVLRGEETQIVGALAQAPRWAQRSLMVLPGTHSKWVTVVDGQVTAFRSFMTGELFALLRQHSTLGWLMPPHEGPRGDPAAFARGLDMARHSDPGAWLHELFSTRTLGLTGQLPAAGLADYLSGQLVGHELRAGLAGVDGDLPLVLVGEPRLSRRYAEALGAFGRPDAVVLGNTAAAGLWQLARAAGLVH